MVGHMLLGNVFQFQVILIIMIVVMWSRMTLVVDLFHVAGEFFQDTCILLIQPLWTFLILVVYLIYWIFVLAWISTAGEDAESIQDVKVYNKLYYFQ